MKLFFLRNCPIWNFQIPAQSIEEIPNWIAKKLINGGVAIDEATHQKQIAERVKRKAEEKAMKEEAAKASAKECTVLPAKKEPDKKFKKGGKE